MESRKDLRDFCGYDGTRSLSNILIQNGPFIWKGQHNRKLPDHLNVFTCYSNLSKIYKCQNCNFETNMKVSLTHHFINQSHKNLTNQNQSRDVLRQCKYCNFQTYSVLFLLKHSFECDTRDNLNTHEIYSDKKIIKWIECGQCSYKTKCNSNLKKHITRKHSTNFALRHSRQDVTQHRTNIHKNSAINIVWYHCDKCEYETKWKSNLNKHRKMIHLDPASVVWHHCDNCEFKTKHKDKLKQHIATIHTDSTNVVVCWYHCGVCEFKAKAKWKLKQHTKFNHTDDANIVWHHCDKCQFKSKQKGHLLRHIASIHTNSANIVWYHCDQCEHKTKRQDSLKQHIANVHTDSADIVWYRCDICKFQTKWKVTSTKHTKSIRHKRKLKAHAILCQMLTTKLQ